MSAKQADNNKLQGSVAAYVVGLLITKLRKVMLSLSVKNILKSVNIWQSYKQERALCHCLVHFLSLLAVCWPGAQSA